MKIIQARLVALGIFALGIMGVDKSWSSDIRFNDNSVAVGIAGTMKGYDIAETNSYAIWCMQERKECLVSSLDQIGDKVNYPYSVPIVRWSKTEIVAASEVNSWTCVRTLITILRNSQTATWVEERVNAGKGTCSNDKMVHRWSIE